MTEMKAQNELYKRKFGEGGATQWKRLDQRCSSPTVKEGTMGRERALLNSRATARNTKCNSERAMALF
jgi:hypothetical protein